LARTIDVTGLPPEAIRAIECLVLLLREKAAPPALPPVSVFDLFGTAPTLRTGEDIAKQLREERDDDRVADVPG
jgi:hypothetical protein